MRLTPLQREDRRRRAIAALAQGLTQRQVATMLETSVASVSQWKTRFHRGGVEELAAKPQGRPARLAAVSAMDQVGVALLAGGPERHGLPAGIWDSAAVATLIERATGTRVSRWTVLRYLDAWRMTPPAFTMPSDALDAGPRRSATTVVVQGAQRDAHWLLWARRPRGEWSVLAHPQRPSTVDAEHFVERLLIQWPARLSLVAPPGDPIWTAATLARCAARWPSRLSIPGDQAGVSTHQKKLVTLS